MNTEIGIHGYSIPLKNLPPHFLENIKSELTVKPIENPNFPSTTGPFAVFRLSKTKIYIPQFYGIEKYGKPKINKLINDTTINLQFNGELRPVQEHTIEESMKAFKDHNSALISLDTGLGKTVVALKLISLLSVKTIILVHAEFLLEQWIARIKQFLPDARIGIIRQEKCETEDVDITVGMIQTIIKREIDFKGYNCTIIDECHHSCAKSFSSVFYKIQTRYTIGLSATPERKDGLTKILNWFMGPLTVSIKRETGKPVIKFINVNTDHVEEKFNKLGKINNPTMITDISKRIDRNELIINTIKNLLKENRKILLLSDRRDHCNYLLNCSDGFSAGVYLGGMKTECRELTTSYSVIYGTYQACGEGFDIPELDTLILATPKSDVEQAVGRILRQKNKNEPLVIDFVDSFSIFKGQFYKRKKFYKNNEFKMT